MNWEVNWKKLDGELTRHSLTHFINDINFAEYQNHINITFISEIKDWISNLEIRNLQDIKKDYSSCGNKF
jgi:hypothetical protein